MKTHLIATAIGLVIGLLAVAFLGPQTAGGATLILVLAMLVTNAIALALGRRSEKGDASPPSGN
jgi:O-antigen/teichoic acid export membrane protein